jgi:hypothetical protein
MRIRLLIILFGAAVVAATYTFPIWRPFFQNTAVTDPFPGLPADLQAEFVLLPPEQQAAYLQMAASNRDMAIAVVTAALADPVIAPEDPGAPDTATAVRVTRGTFTRIDPVLWAQGTVTVYALPDNRKILRLEDFEAPGGPELTIVLSASPAPRTLEELELGNLDFEVGALMGNIGNQNYSIPPEVDLSLYNSVVIYSKPYQLIFSSAAI